MSPEPSRASRDPPLPPGSRIGHYEILNELGRGGMGVVYRARDLGLDRQVALKTPHPSQVTDEVSRHRFLRAARLSCSVVHGNIVTIFEVFEDSGLPWLAMEYIEGTSLRDMLAPGRPLPVDRTLRYAEHLGNALQAAHRKHVLHRDVKPGNVLVARDDRALLMDFGLAGYFASEEDGSELTTLSQGLTVPGTVMGTVGYMSPEQLLGKPTDQRSDIFSLGTVLYEMATGHLAFSRSAEGAVVDKVLHHEPEAISRLNYEVPAELERIVRKCLAKHPDERFQHADELLADLLHLRRSGDAYPDLTSEPGPVRRPRPAVGQLAATAVLAVAVTSLILLWVFFGRGPPRPGDRAGPAGPSVVRASVAVMPFADRTGQPDGPWRASMLANLLAAHLADARRLRPVAGARIEEILASEAPEAPQGPRLADVIRLTQPDWLITGHLYTEGSGYEAAVEVLQPGAGRAMTSFRVRAARVTALVDQVAASVQQRLFPDDRLQMTRPARPVTADTERARLLEYRGRRSLRQARYLAAIDDLEAAVELAPGLVTAYVSLARALNLSGFTRRALDTAAAGRRLAERQSVSTYTRLTMQSVEARVQENTGHELEILETLALRYADDPGVLLTLAAALRRDGQPDRALPRIEQALALDDLDPRLHLERARIALDLAQHDDADQELARSNALFLDIPSPAGQAEVAMVRGLSAFRRQEFVAAESYYRRAVDLFEQAGQSARAVRARKAVGDTELHRGRLESALELYEPALDEAHRHGDFVLVIDTLNAMAARLISRGRYVDAERQGRRALEEARRIENSGLTLAVLTNLSSAVGSAGRPAESLALSRETLSLARERGDRRRELFALSRIGDADFQLGDLDQAEESYRTVIQLVDTPDGPRDRLSAALASLGGVLHTRNRDAEAVDVTTRAVALEREMGRRSLLAYYLMAQAAIQAALTRWDAAASSIDETEQLAREGGLTDVLPRVGLVRGRILAWQGHWDEALPYLEQARDAGRKSRALGLETSALILLADALRNLGRHDEAVDGARQAVDHELAFPTERVLARATLAHALAAAGNLAAALHEARRAMDEAERYDMPLVLARAGAVVSLIEPAPPDAEVLLGKSRAALERYLAGFPRPERDRVIERADIAEDLELLEES